MTASQRGARMQPETLPKPAGLRGRIVVITRPVGTGAGLARRVRALGGMPLLLPGLALHAVEHRAAAREGLRAALADQLIVFTSPAAVRHAAALLPLRTTAMVLAVGQGTARALRRHGIAAPLTPRRQQDSEGLLELAELQQLRGRRVALIGAPGGRGVLRAHLAARGARLREVHVYRRVPPRLDRRHVEALNRLPASAQVLLSSAEALHNLQHGLPAPAWARLCAATAVVSSERLAGAARAAGFRRLRIAASAVSADLLAEALSAS
ncbi:uroporphyrinogen-III synthase [Rhodanobacter ginsengiterrae]|uniref:uroporphyrinogen-III synthase n=1 Tax=Rhodanobacter ginsengiterrae TaxID=2008451 RepID=UPI003CEF9514